MNFCAEKYFYAVSVSNEAFLLFNMS